MTENTLAVVQVRLTARDQKLLEAAADSGRTGTVRRWTWILPVIAMLACGGSTALPTPSFIGRWALVSVNGQSLPYFYGADSLFGPDSEIVGAFATLSPIGVTSTMLEDYYPGGGRVDDAIVERQHGNLVLHWPTTFPMPYDDPLGVLGDSMTLVSARWTGTPALYIFVRTN